LLKIQVAQKKVKIAFENADSSSRVELIPSKIKYANKVVLSFHKEFSVFSSLSIKENDGLLQDQVFKNKEEEGMDMMVYLLVKCRDVVVIVVEDECSNTRVVTIYLINLAKSYESGNDNSIQNGDHPLPVVAQVSLAETAQNAPPTLKDPKFWTAEEKKTRKIDHRKTVIWYEYETFKVTEGEQLLDIYLRYLQVINDLKKCGYKKDNCDVNDTLGYKKKAVVVTSDPLTLVAEKTTVSKHKEKVEVQTESEGSNDKDISDLKKITALLAKTFNRKNGKKEDKKADEKKRDMSKVKCYNCKKERHFAKDCKKSKVKDYNYYKTKMLLAKKDSDEQVLLAKDQAWIESKYYDNSTNYGLFVNDNDDQENFQDAIESASENFNENHIDSQKDCDESEVDHNDSEENDHFVDKLIQKFNHKIAKCHKRIKKANQQSKDLENQNKDLQEKHDVLINQVNTFEEKNSEFNEQMKVLNKKNADLLAQTEVLQEQLKKDNLYNGRKGIGFENPSYFGKAKDLRPSFYDEKVIGLGYTPMFLTHSNEALENEKFKRAGENKIEFAYDYGNLNVSYVNEKINFSDDYFQEIINPDFEKIDSPFQQTSSLKPYVPTVILENIIIDLEDEVASLLAKEKANLETIASLKLKGFESSENAISESENQSENDCQVVEKWCGQVENLKVVAPGMFNHSKLNKDVKRYSRKDLLSCNNSHLGEMSSAFDCNDAMNVSCDSRLYDSYDENNLFIFDDESVRNSQVSEMAFRKKPRDSLNVRSKSNSNKSFPRTVHRWLPKMQPLAELVDKWIPKIVQICLWIINSGCSKHKTGNRAVLTNFVKKFLGTVRFGNNDFAVIAGYGDVGLEVAFRKSTCFVRTEDGVDLLTSDRSSNLYTISLNEVVSNSSACLLENASSSQSWLWHQRLSHLNFTTINNLVKNNLVQGLSKMKFKKDHLCSACEQRKIHQKHHNFKAAFASNKPLYLLHMDLCGPMRVESINGKRYVLVVVDDYSQYTWEFFLHSKDEASVVIISFIKKTQVNLQLQVQRVRTDNGTEFKNKTLAKLFDEVGIAQQFPPTRTPQQKSVMERRNHTLVEAARTMLTFANIPLFLWLKPSP
nr:hypothetical protein [Tanacetum cinerariifolium]